MMSTLIVGSNPSVAKSGKSLLKLFKWVSTPIFSFTNVSTICTPNNRPLKKSEYQLERLCTECQNYDKIITLGNTANEALTLLGIQHFQLPHPSGLNRKLNNKEYLTKVLSECQKYLQR